MILKSITINGFKSFGKKTVIDISHNVTGVVGPNGSGKSNIAEAIRFVLGEQSMKSIRSKSMGDLVFKGTDTGGALSRASVSMEIDNTVKTYGENVAPDLAKFLNFDTIVLSREVFLDGGSVYKMNAAEVRLKDVQSVLALAGIGAGVHTIISQGQADGILLANPSERREMIEDALGLRIHQIRLKDSDRKLKKTEEHFKTVTLLRRELAPSLAHLRIQMDKINRVEGEREKLLTAYIQYFSYENSDILNAKNSLHTSESLETQIQNIKNKIAETERLELEIENAPEKNRENKRAINENRITLERELSQLHFEKKQILVELQKEVKDIVFRHSDFTNLSITLKSIISRVSDIQYVKIEIEKVLDIFSRYEIAHVDQDLERARLSRLEETEKLIINKIDTCMRESEDLDKKDSERFVRIREVLNQKSTHNSTLRDLETKKQTLKFEIERLSQRESDFNFELQEATKFVGSQVLAYHNTEKLSGYDHFQNKKQIERIKIRIEEIGILDPTTIKCEFGELSARDIYLERELGDITNTRHTLDALISELKETIKLDFVQGLEKINFTFNNFFHDIFSGGRAKLFITTSKIENENGELVETEGGIDIDISLPQKRVTDLNMLSGGEKTLSSIALLFALTSITPPPFMVLDETDAALDEMNARKYGKLLQKLAQKSRLLVITHNRETMNQCDVLYGVTLGGDGASRMLSIKFD